ncbi:hypothetical protein PV325_007090 [Microctonus aethiopoides]|nr:hypothetical protein PV325_007090 [Microctonus aethiopoides]
MTDIKSFCKVLFTGVNVILQTGFSEIVFVDDFRSSTKRESIKLVDSNHIVKVLEIQEDGQMFIEGFCIRQTSVTAAPYYVQFEVCLQHNVTDREEVERRRALKAIEEMRRASEEQICIEKCAAVFIEASCNSSHYGTMFHFETEAKKTFFENHVEANYRLKNLPLSDIDIKTVPKNELSLILLCY